jgi:hypothetical protein
MVHGSYPDIEEKYGKCEKGEGMMRYGFTVATTEGLGTCKASSLADVESTLINSYRSLPRCLAGAH